MQLPSSVALAIACALLLVAGAAAGDGRVTLRSLRVEGNEHTRTDTFEELLPRSMPARYTRAEIEEVERRVRALELFDEVDVDIQGDVLRVRVQQKTTISPIVELSTGKTLEDTAGTLGLIEHDFLGRGIELGGSVAYSNRGPEVEAWIMEHSFRPRRWNFELETFFHGAGVRFEDAPSSWQRTRAGAEISLKAPYAFNSPLRYEYLLQAYREILTFVDEAAAQPPDGVYVGVGSELTWDRYRFHDLAPSGFRTTLELRPGVYVGPSEPRHEVVLTTKIGVPLWRDKTALVVRVVGDAANGGNPNHSALIGSQRGVRGLSDTLYRSGWIAFANVELRHAFEIARRWYLQPVAFSDGGCFQSLAPDGGFRKTRCAVSLGAGVRLLPTALVDTMLRLDGARLVSPVPTPGESPWLLQFGLSQYF